MKDSIKKSYDMLLDISNVVPPEEVPDHFKQLLRDCGDFINGKWEVEQSRYSEVVKETIVVCKQDFREIGRPDLAAALNVIAEELAGE